jgi:hypothetical protein
MVDPMLIHDLWNDDIVFPDNLRSDVAKISWFARENNISLEELKNALQKFVRIHQPPEDAPVSEKNDFYFVKMWLDTVKKALQTQETLVGNLPVLDTRMTDSGGKEYAAYVTDKVNRPVVHIVQKRTDDEYGMMTGIPNAEYWDGTPASYYVSTLLGKDEINGERARDRLYIDFGQRWYIDGVSALVDELEEEYGDKIQESIRAKKVYEALDDVLKPKSYQDIANQLPKSSGFFEVIEFLENNNIEFSIDLEDSLHYGGGEDAYGDTLPHKFISFFFPENDDLYISYASKNPELFGN